jgi:hypothetical protein
MTKLFAWFNISCMIVKATYEMFKMLYTTKKAWHTDVTGNFNK